MLIRYYKCQYGVQIKVVDTLFRIYGLSMLVLSGECNRLILLLHQQQLKLRNKNQYPFQQISHLHTITVANQKNMIIKYTQTRFICIIINDHNNKIYQLLIVSIITKIRQMISKLTKQTPQKQKTLSKQNICSKKSVTNKQSKNISKVYSPDCNMEKNNNKKKVASLSTNLKSGKKKQQAIVSSLSKSKQFKQNKTPTKKQQYSKVISSICLNGPQQKHVIAAIKRIKNKIIGDNQAINNKYKLQVTSMMPLKQKSQNIICPVISKFTSEDESQNKIHMQQKTQTKQANRNQTKMIKIQNFEFGKKLGKGRFGNVYIARDKLNGFILAIKVINKKQLKESDMQNQLIQQIKTQSFCNHPNLLKLYGCLSDETSIYLLLQLGTHNSLFMELKHRKYLSQENASHWIKQVTSGIRSLHCNNIIHRDIKPQNIVNCFGILKLCDFGWAAYSPIYQRQTFCGTLDYVSPEIVTGQYYDEKVDIWCLGVLCYELCTGKPPFESKNNVMQVYNKILNVDIEYPISLSLSLVDLLSKLLDKDPKKRISLEEVQCHDWIRNTDNENGRMIGKQIWMAWVKLCQ